MFEFALRISWRPDKDQIIRKYMKTESNSLKDVISSKKQNEEPTIHAVFPESKPYVIRPILSTNKILCEASSVPKVNYHILGSKISYWVVHDQCRTLNFGESQIQWFRQGISFLISSLISLFHYFIFWFSLSLFHYFIFSLFPDFEG